MTTKQHSHYLKFLSQGYNILLLSDKNIEYFDNISADFDSANQRNLTQIELDNLTFTLMNNNIDIVLLDFTQSNDLLDSFCESILSYNERIVLLGIVKDDIKSLSDIKKMDEFILESFTLEELKDKIFKILSIYYTVKSISRRDVNIGTGSSELSSDLDEFFDMYEGSSLFIVDELMEMSQALHSGELSPKLISNIADKILEIAHIFNSNEEIKDVYPIFNDFAKFLNGLDLGTIEPSSLHAFDYLAAIIDDTNTNLMDMFVDRLFKDVYIFEHSLENNIKFMKNALTPDTNNDESELEFF